MKTRVLFLMLFFSLMMSAQAQVSINQEGNDPHESAMLDLSSNDKGLLIPRMSSVERQNIENPANGLMVFDTNTNSFWFFSDATASWEEMGGAIVSVLNDLLDAKTDANSIYIGQQTATNDDGDNFNTVIGIQALKENSSGNKNVAIGSSALKQNTTGNNNTAIGTEALKTNQNGLDNVAIGKETLNQNIGSRNTAIGSGAGRNSYQTHGNIFIGYEAGKNEGQSNKLYIENSNSNLPLIGGDFSTDEVVINGTLAITGGVPAQGKVLTSDENGKASWEVLNGGAQSINELEDAITDDNSVYVGAESGINDQGNNYNTALGQQSLKMNTSGESNTAIGLGALKENTTGKENTAIGLGAMVQNETGENNVAVGYGSLGFANTAGSGNVAIGDRSLLMNSGSENTVLGKGAGQNSNGNASGNIFIGYEAGKEEDGSNKLYIENSDSPTPLIGGDFDSDEVVINGTLKITGGNPLAGKVLTTDNNGNASWETASNGAEDLNDLSDASSSANSLYLGLNSGQNQVNDNYNTAVGQYSLMNSNSGFSNTAMGNSAMFSSTTGQNNTAIGISALHLNTQGNQNTTIGSYSLYNNTGGYNTAIGYQAGYGIGEYNTFGNVLIGYQAGYYETESDKLYIENSNSNTPLIGGDFNTDEVVINGTLAITGGNPAAGKILVSDSEGKASWQDAIGAQDINGLTDGKTNGETMYLGTSAGESDNTNSQSTGFGYESLNNNTGLYNNAFGHASLFSNTTGFSNNAFGRGALDGNITGKRNIGFGNFAMHLNQTGNDNTAIGNAAGGGTSEDISGSVFIGSGAGYNETENNKLYIENTTSETPLIGGDFNADYVDINGDLNILGNVKIEGGTPGNGKVLTSDSEGNASWQTSNAGVGSIDDLSDAKNDNSSLLLGSIGGADDGANFNTAVGVSALNSNASGQYNAALGKSALTFNSTGNNNTAIGAGSMELNTEGHKNTAVGSGALYNNSGGDRNTAIGFEAGFGSYGSDTHGSVFIGYQAGYFETNTNKLYIDNSNTDSPLIYGDFNLNKLKINGEFSVNNDNIKVNNTNVETNVNIKANKPIEAHDDIIISDEKNIIYENSRTSKLQLSGLDFQADFNSIDNYLSSAHYGPGGIYIFTQEEYLTFGLYAPIKLPQNVTITKITIGFAASVGTSIDIKITKKTPMELMGEGDQLMDIEYTFNTIEIHSYSFDGLSNATVDNDYVYFLDIGGDLIKEDGVYNAGISILTATIEYEYDTLNH